MVDGAGHMPLHSLVKCKTENDVRLVKVVQVLAEAYPPALTTPTELGDTPLHLACLRNVSPVLIKALADLTAVQDGLELEGKDEENCTEEDGRQGPHGPSPPSLLLSNPLRRPHGRPRPRPPLRLRPNRDGLTPLHALMNQYCASCGLWAAAMHTPGFGDLGESYDTASQEILFGLIAHLVRLAHFGPDFNVSECGWKSIVHAALWIRRRNGAKSVDGAFVKELVESFPNQIQQRYDVNNDGEEGKNVSGGEWRGGMGDLPLHIEAGVAWDDGCIFRDWEEGLSVVDHLLRLYPAAARERDSNGIFPLARMVQSRRTWGAGGIQSCLKSHPPALLCGGVFRGDIGGDGDLALIPLALERVGRGSDLATLFGIVRSKPDLIKV